MSLTVNFSESRYQLDEPGGVRIGEVVPVQLIWSGTGREIYSYARDGDEPGDDGVAYTIDGTALRTVTLDADGLEQVSGTYLASDETG